MQLSAWSGDWLCRVRGARNCFRRELVATVPSAQEPVWCKFTVTHSIVLGIGHQTGEPSHECLELGQGFICEVVRAVVIDIETGPPKIRVRLQGIGVAGYVEVEAEVDAGVLISIPCLIVIELVAWAIAKVPEELILTGASVAYEVKVVAHVCSSGRSNN